MAPLTRPGDSRTFFYHPGCNDLLSETNLPVEAVAQAGAGLFYLGYLNLLGALDALQDGQTGTARVLAQALLGAGVQRAVIIHTPALGLWAGRHAVVTRVPDPAAMIVNPLGAGDAFCTGVIWGIHQGWTPERALALGHRATAECLKGKTATGSIPDLNTLLTGL